MTPTSNAHMRSGKTHQPSKAENPVSPRLLGVSRSSFEIGTTTVKPDRSPRRCESRRNTQTRRKHQPTDPLGTAYNLALAFQIRKAANERSGRRPAVRAL